MSDEQLDPQGSVDQQTSNHNPLFDIEIITAEEAKAASSENSIDDSGFTLDPNRPVAGVLGEDEPTKEEIHNAWKNVPDENLKFQLGDETLCVVDLTKSNMSVYLDVFISQLEQLINEFKPIFMLCYQAYMTYRNIGLDAQAALKEIAKLGTKEQLKQACLNLGADASDEDLDSMRLAAENDKPLEFIFSMISIFMKPMFGPAGKAFEDLKLSALIKRLDKVSTDLAYASITSIYIREGNKDWSPDSVRAKMELLDTFDELDIVYLQFQKYWNNGKLARFFPQIREIIQRSFTTATR